MELSAYFPMWGKLDPAHQQVLNASAMSISFRKKQLLHDGMRDCTGLILVRSGQIRAYTLSNDGREITMYRLFDRDICLFSASCMMNSIQFDLIIEAEKDTDVFLIPAEVYKSIMEVSAPLSNFTTEIMASRFSDVMWLINQIMWKSFDKRLAEFLQNEAILEGTTELSITHETIGNHLGNPREVVTRMLKYFQNEGMVQLSRGRIRILESPRWKDLLKE